MVLAGKFVGGGDYGYHHLSSSVGVGSRGVGVGSCFLVALQIVESVLQSREGILGVVACGCWGRRSGAWPNSLS